MTERQGSNWKKHLKSFSDEVFRNYLIMRARWEISRLERQRSVEIRDLGNRVYRLIRRRKIQLPELDSQVQSLDELELQIQKQEEKLREIILKTDVPCQIPETAGTGTDNGGPRSVVAVSASEERETKDEGRGEETESRPSGNGTSPDEARTSEPRPSGSGSVPGEEALSPRMDDVLKDVESLADEGLKKKKRPKEKGVDSAEKGE